MSTHEQRMKALQTANEVRFARKRLKADLAAGRTNVARVMTNLPPHANTMRVDQLLAACPGVGRVKIARLLSLLDFSPSRQLASLTERERVQLLLHLRSLYPNAWDAWRETQRLPGAAVGEGPVKSTRRTEPDRDFPPEGAEPRVLEEAA